MAQWKIHVAWAIATLIVAGSWGRHCSGPTEGKARSKEATGGISTPASEAPLAPGETAPTSAIPATSASRAPTDAETPPAYTSELLTVGDIRALIHSRSRHDWWRALRAIEHLVDKGLKKDLLLEFVSCEEEMLRFSALSQLANMIGTECLPLLQKALQSDPSAWVRRNAALQLGKFGGDGTVETLLQAVHDKDLYVRVNVAAALNQLGHPGVVADLVPLLAKDLDSPDDAVRREAVENISDLKSPLAIPPLLRALKDGNGDVRAQASIGLVHLDVPEVVTVMEGLLKDSAMAETAKEILDDIKTWKARKK